MKYQGKRVFRFLFRQILAHPGSGGDFPQITLHPQFAIAIYWVGFVHLSMTVVVERVELRYYDKRFNFIKLFSTYL